MVFVKRIPQGLAIAAYIIAMLLMAFGWVCAAVQGDALCALTHPDAPPPDPRIAGIVIIFAASLALLVVPAVRLWRAKRIPALLMSLPVGLQAVFCLYVIAMEFTL